MRRQTFVDPGERGDGTVKRFAEGWRAGRVRAEVVSLAVVIACCAAPVAASAVCVTVLNLAFAPQSADVAYAGLYGDLSECGGAATVMRSDDGGRSWRPAAGARSWTHVLIPLSVKYTCVECGFPVPALAFDAKDPATLYLVGPGGLVRTRDSGAL